MDYIVLDLEWNQGNAEPAEKTEQLSFEIIEIGAVKVNDKGVMIGKFSELVKPQVHHELHQVTSALIHMKMKELERGKPFLEVAERFLQWCGEDYCFCTWGSLDLTELQKNMRFYNMPPLSDAPIPYLDAQKLFGIAYENCKNRRSLEYAVGFLQIKKDIPFHRAFSDAYYTAKVLSRLIREKQAVLVNVSYDVFNPPKSRKDEIRVQFENYAKYISREFESKEEAFMDREVVSSKCYLCHCNLRKRIKWFTDNSRNYYCLAFCEKHGYLKGKIRIRKSYDDKIYIVKTTKLVSEEDAEKVVHRRNHARELRKRRKHNLQ